jgi:hypothetical protein
MRDRTLSPWRAPFWQKMPSESLVISSFVDISMTKLGGWGVYLVLVELLPVCAENNVIVMKLGRNGKQNINQRHL